MLKRGKKIISLIHKKLLLVRYYSNKTVWTVPKKEKKKIIICFDGIFSHGGLVDRLKGIVSFYEIAKNEGYDFYIYFNHPFVLSDFLQPNAVPWQITTGQLKYSLFNTKILYLMDNFEINPLEIIRNSTAQTLLVYSNIDYLGTLYPMKNETELRAIWRQNYHELFTPSNALQLEITRLPQDSIIAFHTRFTSLMGDFKDTTSSILPASTQLKLMRQLIEKIQEIAFLHPNCRPYVLSDSVVFLNYIKENTSFGVLSGDPKHIGIKNNNQDSYSQYKTFTDFYFMSKSDAVYLLRMNPMYHSSFSKYAASVGNVSFTVLHE